MEFHYDGFGSPYVINVLGTGIGANIKVVDDSAYAGTVAMTKLQLLNEVSPKTNGNLIPFKAKIQYNATLLHAIDKKATSNINEKNIERVEINGYWDTKTPLISEFETLVSLGDALYTPLILEEFDWLDESGMPLNFPTELYHGTFKLLGVCTAGGIRLYSPGNKIKINKASPNPAIDFIVVEFNLEEIGYSEISVVNTLGVKVLNGYQELTINPGDRVVSIDVASLHSGCYFLQLKTPTGVNQTMINIVR